MKKNLILFIVSFAMLMEAVDTTIINTAIPVVAKSLQVNPLDLKLALISYLVSLAIFIPISGWIAEKFGIKKIFITAIIIFTVSSVWCGFAETLGQLIVARFIQGLGGSLTLPVGRLIIVRTCERHELVSKMSIVVMVAALGLMLGPVLSGFIVGHFSWRWIFWVNAPVGVFAIFLSLFFLPAMPPIPIHRLDKAGFVLFGSGLAVLTYGLAAFSESAVHSGHSLILVMIALLLLITYTLHSRKNLHPVVKIELIRLRTFRVSVLGNLLARLGFGGIPFLLPMFLQISLGFSPQLSGLLLAPTALGVLLVKPLAIYALRFLGYKRLLILNTVMVGLSVWAFSSIDQTSSIYYIGFLTFLFGFLISLQYTGMNSLAYANIANKDVSAATSIMSTTQQLAQSFGVAAAAILVSVFAETLVKEPVLTLHTFHRVFMSMGMLTILSLFIFTQLNSEDGIELIKKPSVDDM